MIFFVGYNGGAEFESLSLAIFSFCFILKISFDHKLLSKKNGLDFFKKNSLVTFFKMKNRLGC